MLSSQRGAGTAMARIVTTTTGQRLSRNHPGDALLSPEPTNWPLNQTQARRRRSIWGKVVRYPDPSRRSNRLPIGHGQTSNLELMTTQENCSRYQCSALAGPAMLMAKGFTRQRNTGCFSCLSSHLALSRISCRYLPKLSLVERSEPSLEHLFSFLWLPRPHF